MILHLFRHLVTPTQTRGALFVNGSVFCVTLEDGFRQVLRESDKVYGKTCIPPGRYRLVVSLSNRFKKKTPEILSVPFFAGIRLHAGRDLVENGDVVDSLGCPLLLPQRPGDTSGPTLTDRLVSVLEGTTDAHWIEVVNGWQGNA